MASTPPAQIRAEVHTPPTPLHGSAYHSNPSPSRYNTRSSDKKAASSTQSSFTQSPKSPRDSRTKQSSHLHPQSPQATPKRKSTRHVQVLSPASSDSDTAEPSSKPQKRSAYLSAATVLADGMLPTPVKTPQKNKFPKSSVAGRALFQDQADAMFPSPRKSKKMRHNGFSLESFSENNAAQDSIQIHIDSRDQVPEIDTSEDNPFHAVSATKKRAAPTTAQKGTRSSKRRKVSDDDKKPLDPQVEEAIEKDEGMVYVFRGKKVYRRFEDAGDEEEVIDPEELGLLEHVQGQRAVRPYTTLTRKSIKPRRLFQDDQAELPPQASQSDEEADTDIEKDGQAEDLEEEQSSPSRPRRSRNREISNGSPSAGASAPKKRSPFDSWPRSKSGRRSGDSVPAATGRKRTAAEALDI